MKALTICQPFASLICLPDVDGRHKRVENRKWPWDHRGPLAIHAGKSRDWLSLDIAHSRDEEYDLRIDAMPFGAIVAVVDMIDCVQIEDVNRFRQTGRGLPTSLRWLCLHQHCEGPWCHVYANVRPLVKPIPWKGKQGPWSVPDDIVNSALADWRAA